MNEAGVLCATGRQAKILHALKLFDKHIVHELVLVGLATILLFEVLNEPFDIFWGQVSQLRRKAVDLWLGCFRKWSGRLSGQRIEDVLEVVHLLVDVHFGWISFLPDRRHVIPEHVISCLEWVELPQKLLSDLIFDHGVFGFGGCALLHLASFHLLDGLATVLVVDTEFFQVRVDLFIRHLSAEDFLISIGHRISTLVKHFFRNVRRGKSLLQVRFELLQVRLSAILFFVLLDVLIEFRALNHLLLNRLCCLCAVTRVHFFEEFVNFLFSRLLLVHIFEGLSSGFALLPERTSFGRI